MSNIKSLVITAALTLLAQTASLSAGEIFEGLVETTYDDPKWVLVTSDCALRENLCNKECYEKVFEPCHWKSGKPASNRYWKLSPCAKMGLAFPMTPLVSDDWLDSFDGLYVREGFGFQLYSNTEYPADSNDLEPAGPYMSGPKYVCHTYVLCRTDNCPNGFEPRTFFVDSSGLGALIDYSIIVYPNPLGLNKTDDVNDGDCVYPFDSTDENYLNYEICWENQFYGLEDPNNPGSSCIQQDAENVIITDFLPVEVDFNSAGPAEVNWVYDANSRTVTWDIGDIAYGESNCVHLSVKVNNLAKPGGVIGNYYQIEGGYEIGGDTFTTLMRKDTTVCCYRSPSIYVDKDANGLDNGTSWKNAYTELRDALKEALDFLDCNCSEVWAAEGTYKPTGDPSDRYARFILSDGLALYGGFAGTESALYERNYIENETILTGDIDVNGTKDAYYVVAGYGTNQATVIDGLTIIKANETTIELKDIYSGTIAHCKIQDGYGWAGINCVNSSLGVISCIIKDNYTGISCDDCNLAVSNCIIKENSAGGIYCDDGTAVIKNSWISKNSGKGIELDSPDEAAEIRNNTIAKNSGYGILKSTGADPNISNCILWRNYYNGVQLPSGYPVTYSCIMGGYDGNSNIDDDPCFADELNYNYHITPNSPCIDAGDPGLVCPVDEMDIDREARIYNGNDNGTKRVDIGADELSYAADYDHNEIVDFDDYVPFANDWMSDDSNCSLDNDDDIDGNDLDLFSYYWLVWKPQWKVDDWQLPMGGRGGGGDFTEGFYAESMTFSSQQSESADAEDQQDKANIKAFIYWLDDTWEKGELADIMTDDEYLAFRDSLEELLE